jgi:hypothetical protein
MSHAYMPRSSSRCDRRRNETRGSARMRLHIREPLCHGSWNCSRRAVDEILVMVIVVGTKTVNPREVGVA